MALAAACMLVTCCGIVVEWHIQCSGTCSESICECGALAYVAVSVTAGECGALAYVAVSVTAGECGALAYVAVSVTAGECGALVRGVWCTGTWQ